MTTSVPSGTGPPPAAAPSGPDPLRWWALATVAAAQLMVVLDATVVTIALPSIQRTLHVSTADRQWVLTAYTLAFGGLLLLGGRIADYLGRKRVFVIGLVGFAAASALGGAAQGAAMLYAARALQGAFGAVMAPASLSLLTVTFTESRERAKAFAVYGGIAGGGAAIGLLSGGLLTQYASWRWCLYVNVPIAVVTAVVALRVVGESRAHGRTGYDVQGALSATAGLVALVYGLTEASISGWTAPATLGALCAAAVLLVAFGVFEVRSPFPLLPMRVVIERNRGGSFLASFLAGLAMFGLFLFLTYYLQTVLHYSALKSGFAFLPFSGGIIVAAVAASRLLPRLGPRPLMVVGFVAATAGAAYLTRLGLHSAYVTAVLPSEVVMSLGLGLVFVPLSSTSLIGVEPSDTGVASGLLNATQQVGGSLGVALLNTVFATVAAGYMATHQGTPAAAALSQIRGYSTGYWVSTGVMAAGAVVSLVLIRASRQHVAAAELRPAIHDAA